MPKMKPNSNTKRAPPTTSSGRQTSMLSFLMTSSKSAASSTEIKRTTTITNDRTVPIPQHQTPFLSSHGVSHKITPESSSTSSSLEEVRGVDPQQSLEESVTRNSQLVSSPSLNRHDRQREESVTTSNSAGQADNDNHDSSSDDDDDDDDDSSTSKQEPTTNDNPHGLSDYELLRLRNIERNNARLAALGLLSSAITTTTTTRRNNTTRRRKRPSSASCESRPVPVRRSTRQKKASNEGSAGVGYGTTFATTDGHGTAPGTMEIRTDENLQQPEVVESYTVSPLVQYAMTCTSNNNNTPTEGELEGSLTIGAEFSSLRLLKTRLAPPSRLGAIYSLHFSSQEHATNQWIVGAGKAGVIALWDASAAKTSLELANDQDYATIDPILSWKAHGGRWIAEARLLPSQKQQPSNSHAPPARLLTAANDGAVCLWDLTTVSTQDAVPKLLMRTGKELHASGIFSLDVEQVVGSSTTELRFATASKDKTVKISTLGAEVGWWTSHHHSAKVGDVRFRGRGTSLLASVGDDGIVALHDFRGQRIVAESSRAHARPHSVVWDPTHEHVFMTAGHDKTIKLWDLRRFGEESSPIAVLEGHIPLHETKCKKIHRPIFYNPHGTGSLKWRDSSFVLTGGQQSHSLSMFLARGFGGLSEENQENTLNVSLCSRGRLPEDCGDGVCIASDGNRVAVSTDQAEVLLLEPSRSSESSKECNALLL